MKGWTNFAHSVSVERDMVIDGTNNETDRKATACFTYKRVFLFQSNNCNTLLGLLPCCRDLMFFLKLS